LGVEEGHLTPLDPLSLRLLIPPTSLLSFSPAISSLSKTHFVQNNVVVLERCLGFYRSDGSGIISSIGGIKGRRRVEHGVVAASSNVAALFWDDGNLGSGLQLLPSATSSGLLQGHSQKWTA
jgi:hypothetical protein